MSKERDTHFKNAAELLYAKLVQNSVNSPKRLSEVEAFKQEQHQIIAQFLYDFMEHTMLYAPAAPVPDLTEWPTPEEPS